MWVVVNYSSESNIETFDVNEAEERRCQKNTLWKILLKYGIPILRILSYLK